MVERSLIDQLLHRTRVPLIRLARDSFLYICQSKKRTLSISSYYPTLSHIDWNGMGNFLAEYWFINQSKGAGLTSDLVAFRVT